MIESSFVHCLLLQPLGNRSGWKGAPLATTSRLRLVSVARILTVPPSGSLIECGWSSRTRSCVSGESRPYRPPVGTVTTAGPAPVAIENMSPGLSVTVVPTPRAASKPFLSISVGAGVGMRNSWTSRIILSRSASSMSFVTPRLHQAIRAATKTIRHTTGVTNK